MATSAVERYCDFVPHGGGVRCSVCGVERPRASFRYCGTGREPTAKMEEYKRRMTVPCVHRGREKGRVLCKTCKHGKTDLKLFKCGIHGECLVIAPDDSKLVGCVDCGDYSPTDSEPQ